MHLYIATALKPDGNATAAFLVAHDTDEATAKASKRLETQFDGGKLTHVLKICQASPATLHRNGLLSCCPPHDQVEFTAKAMLETVKKQQAMIRDLTEAVQGMIADAVERRELRHFKFVVVPPWGGVYRHECFTQDEYEAMRRAEQLAAEIHQSSRVLGFQEVKPE